MFTFMIVVSLLLGLFISVYGLLGTKDHNNGRTRR